MSEAAYRVFGLDRQVYGPVTALALKEWARDGRVQRETWIHVEVAGREHWDRAEDLAVLLGSFPGDGSGMAAAEGAEGPAQTKSGVAPKVLSRLKLFADFTADQLEPFAKAMVEESYRPFAYVVKQGSREDGMYFVLQGRLGVAAKGQVTESYLAVLNVGETFGEMSLFDAAPRSADVRADTEVVLLKLGSAALNEICKAAPEAANRFLWNVTRLLSARLRQMDRRAVAEKDMGAAARVAK